jgi:hypothetical protein
MQNSYECDVRRMHEPIPAQSKWLRAVVRGHMRYYGVPMNHNALWIFRFRVGWLSDRALSRRSQNGRVLWDRMRRLIRRWLPQPAVGHPYPLRRMGVDPSGKSRMRETRLSGSVDGVMSNHDPNSDLVLLGSLILTQGFNEGQKERWRKAAQKKRRPARDVKERGWRCAGLKMKLPNRMRKVLLPFIMARKYLFD